MSTQRFCDALGLSLLMLAGSLAGQAAAGIVPGDFDHDCDVDVEDFSHFKSCALGPAIAQPDPTCADARLDPDEDVDLDDFGIFQRCYSGEGNPADPDCNHTCSGEGCDCLCGQTNCSGTCTFTARDIANCGACGNACDAGLTCREGACTPCPGGGTSCSGICTNVAFDTHNCGGCGIVCTGGQTCSGGICQDPW